MEILFAHVPLRLLRMQRARSGNARSSPNGPAFWCHADASRAGKRTTGSEAESYLVERRSPMRRVARAGSNKPVVEPD